MATTPNFNWSTPDNTGLVKNGALDIRTLGDAIDASLVDLKGGTTGQVLSKASGTDMDFTWVSDAAGMTNPMTTTGDTIYSSSGSTPARLGIGSTGQVLTVAAGVPSWATPASGSASFVGASINNESGITVASSTTTTMTFPSESFDTNTFHDNSTNNSRFTIPAGKAGYYEINYTVLYQGYSSDHNVRLAFFKNGSQICLYKGASVAGVGEQNYNFTRTVNLAVSDYIELKVWQDSGISRDFYVNSNQGQAVITYLGA
jgi:hypothetical protein